MMRCNINHCTSVEEGKAQQRLVSLGREDESNVVVDKGLAEGGRVITGNLQKIGPGAPVQPQER